MKNWLVRILKSLGLWEQTVYYIGGADVLPPPLKGEDETRALIGLEQGSEEAKQFGGPDLHWHHWAHQGGGHLPQRPEYQAGHLRLPVY